MPRHWRFLLYIALLGLCCPLAHTQPPPPTGCVAFAPDGALATATIRYGSDIDIKIAEPRAKAIKAHASIPSASACEIAFSVDASQIATVVHADTLQVLLTDRKSGRVLQKFSSPWLAPAEPGDHAFLAGFLPGSSLVLRRYAADGEHIQTWSPAGAMLSDHPRADADANPDLRALLAPKDPRLGLTGEGNRAQIATLSDASGAVVARAALPVPGRISNAPLLGDTVHADKQFHVSADGQVALLARTLYGQIIMATEHDWGSEIEVLTTRPFRCIASRKTGIGGIQALAVDHRDNTIRIVGLWFGAWHDLRWDESHPGAWKKASL